MNLNTLGFVLVLLLVLAWKSELHTKILHADEAQLRAACFHVDELRSKAAPKSAPVVLDPRILKRPMLRPFAVLNTDPTCVARTAAAGATISQARCLSEATSLNEAHLCGDGLP